MDPKHLQFFFSTPYGALLIWVLKVEERPDGIPRFAFPMLLGNASYAIYLVQFVPIAILDMLNAPLSWGFAVIVIGSTILSALTLHYWVEKPTLRLLGQRQKALPR